MKIFDKIVSKIPSEYYLALLEKTIGVEVFSYTLKFKANSNFSKLLNILKYFQDNIAPIKYHKSMYHSDYEELPITDGIGVSRKKGVVLTITRESDKELREATLEVKLYIYKPIAYKYRETYIIKEALMSIEDINIINSESDNRKNSKNSLYPPNSPSRIISTYLIDQSSLSSYSKKQSISIKTRPRRSLALEQMKDIDEALSRYVNSQEKIDSIGAVHKEILFLYGPPGTGKSSIAQYIAHRLKDTVLIFVPPTLLNSNIRDLLHEIESAGKWYTNKIVVIDEFEKIYNPEKVAEYNTLFDSPYTPNNTIFVVTANSNEGFDPSLTREGRLGSSIHTSYLSKELATKYLLENGVNECDLCNYEVLKEEPIEPVKLQTEFISRETGVNIEYLEGDNYDNS